MQLTLLQEHRHLANILTTLEIPRKPLPSATGNKERDQHEQRDPLGPQKPTPPRLCHAIDFRGDLGRKIPPRLQYRDGAKKRRNGFHWGWFDQHRENMTPWVPPLLLGKFELGERVPTLRNRFT